MLTDALSKTNYSLPIVSNTQLGISLYVQLFKRFILSETLMVGAAQPTEHFRYNRAELLTIIRSNEDYSHSIEIPPLVAFLGRYRKTNAKSVLRVILNSYSRSPTHHFTLNVYSNIFKNSDLLLTLLANGHSTQHCLDSIKILQLSAT